jgi:myo-inositol-1(or 4)-monophosphatase
MTSTAGTLTDLELIEPLSEVAREVGEFVLGLPGPGRPATSMRDFRASFEAVDGPAADLARTRLSVLRPRAEWAVEGEALLPGSREVWVVDAVDGAVQYLRGLPQWCVSIALVRDRRPVVAVIHSPLSGETYTAVAGGGAFRDGRPLTPSAGSELALSLLATSQPPAVRDEPDAVRRAGASLSAVLPVVGAVRNLGPTSWQIADTAAGRIDAFWEFGTDDSNLLGAALLAAEAGLLVTDAEGDPWRAGAASFLAAPAGLHAPLLGLLAESR